MSLLGIEDLILEGVTPRFALTHSGLNGAGRLSSEETPTKTNQKQMNSNNNSLLDELNNMDGVDLSFPILPAQQYLFRVNKMELVTSKLKPGETEPQGLIQVEENGVTHVGNCIKISLGLAEPATDVTHKTVRAGFPMSFWISLVAKDTYDPKKSMAKFRLAVTGERGGKFFPMSQYIDRNVPAMVKITEATADYPVGNAIKDWVLPKD